MSIELGEGIKKFLKSCLKNDLIYWLGPGLRDLFIQAPRALFQDTRSIWRMVWNHFKYRNSSQILLSRLRTQAHILDKSLQSENWEAGHGELAWRRCRHLLDSLQETSITDDPSFQWAFDKAKEFEEGRERSVWSEKAYIRLSPEEGISDKIVEFIKSRRSVRSFRDFSIDPCLLVELVETINWAPQSCNRQAAFLYISQRPEIVHESLNQCAGASGFGAHIPCFISICADMRVYELRDRYLPFIDVALGFQNFLLACYAHGIEGTILNWMHHSSDEDRRLREILGIEKYHSILFNFVLGYPLNIPPPPGRKSPEVTYRIV